MVLLEAENTFQMAIAKDEVAAKYRFVMPDILVWDALGIGPHFLAGDNSIDHCGIIQSITFDELAGCAVPFSLYDPRDQMIGAEMQVRVAPGFIQPQDP